jgi:amidohydrolase
MLGLGCGLSPGLHHPKMKFNQDSILTGIEILARAVMGTFKILEEKVSVEENKF